MQYDLVTGTLSSVGSAGRLRGVGDPQEAGEVLWYDPDGGHVARIPLG